ncbi:MAG TPA: hypothetical protein VNY76_08685 [Candidatus Acidoferrales bacterium]|nr:hypothetical protein [Candidatus Acidoferrales bacterium]
MATDWVAWHDQYEADGALVRRLEVVRRLIRSALDSAPAGEIHVVSMCAGDGRDLLGVLADHPRRADVRARLVELQPTLVERAQAAAARLELDGIEVVCGDAARTDAYENAVPAEVVLVCGIFGNITDEDIRGTVDHLPEFCAPHASVVWTRGRFEPDITPQVRQWFNDAGFVELDFVRVPDSTATAGLQRLRAKPRPLQRGVQLFTFLSDEERPGRKGR